MTEADTVLRVTGLRTQFGRDVIHEDLSLEVRRGEVMGIVGGSGAGKSVLLRTIIGLQRAAAGKIEIFGRDMSTLSDADRRVVETRCGVVFQDGALFSSLTVAQNVMVPLKEHTDLPEGLLQEVASLKIGLAGLSRDACAKFPSELSGGMRKRAGLARSLALDPEILFLDEPTAGLDPIGAAAFDSLIRGLQQTMNLTVVMVTHDLDSLFAICDRVAVLVDKHVIIGTLQSLLRETHPWINEYFHGPRGRTAQTA